MERDPLQATHAQWGEAVVVLQTSERALDGGTAPVQLAPALRLARDERVQPRSLDPPARGLALARWTPPLGKSTLVVSTRERPAAVLALGRVVVPPLDARPLLKRDDRQHTDSLARFVDGCHVPSVLLYEWHRAASVS